MPQRRLLEICVDDIEGLHAAVQVADRVELCSALALGGLTPSPGLISAASNASIDVYAMIRPRPGDFIYTEREVDTMKREIDVIRAAGLAGVVFGANSVRGTLDEKILVTLMDHSSGLGTTLHRAIDLTPDLLEALEIAIALKVERVLTSGGAKSAEAGVDRIAQMVRTAGDRIGVMAGSGITAGNALAIIEQTGVREIHASCSTAVEANPAALAMGFVPSGIRRTDPAAAAALGRIIRTGAAPQI